MTKKTSSPKTPIAAKTVKPVKKAVAPAKKAAVKPAEPAKKAAPAKKAVAKPVAPVAKKAAPAKKAVAKPVAPVAKKAAPAKKAVAKPVAPAAKKAVAKTVAPVAKKAAPVKKAVLPAEEHHTVHRKLRLTKTQKKHYFDILMKLRAEYVAQQRYHQDEALASKKDAAGERAGLATHMADLGSDNFRHELELGLLSDEGDVIQMIDESLQKLEDSEYGICIECGCEIAPARLEAKPYARFCTKCKSMHEKMEDPLRRHR